MTIRSELRRWQYAHLALYAEACVDPQLSPEQQLQRLNMLKALIQDISDQIESEADAAAERPSDEERLREMKTRQRAVLE